MGMEKKTRKLRSHCPINFGLETFGDKWSLLILRDIVFRGKKTFSDFLKSEEKIASNILAARLDLLREEGILKKRVNPEDGRKDIHVLTEKGLDLIPLLFEMMLWSSKFDLKSESKKCKKLINSIKLDNRDISQKIIARVASGQSVFPEYLDKIG